MVAGYYFLYVTRNSQYFVDRDLRLLGAMAIELQALIDNDREVLGGLIDDPYEANGNRYFRIAGDQLLPRPTALERIPVLSSLESVKRKGDGPLSLRFFEPTTDTFWSPKASEKSAAPGVTQARISLESLVKPLFVGEIQRDIFESLALITTDGRVIVQTGNPDLTVSNVSKLFRRLGSKTVAELGADALTHSADVFDVRVSGTDYELFVRECCGTMRAFASRGDQDAVFTGEHGWMLAGLVPQSQITAAAYAFPFSAVQSVTALLLLTVFSVPFIKLLLIGELQRITAPDVLLVGVCALMGASFVTLFAMDRYAATSLADTLDAQLQTLSSNIRVNAKMESDLALSQLKALEATYQERRTKEAKGRGVVPNTTATTCEGGTRDIYGLSSAFDTFVLIDVTGCQRVKWSSGSLVTPLISVKSREYFTHWLENEPADRPFVEPIRSATTGTLEAVLSMPAATPGLQVAALTIPMRSLLNPVLINGFGFAVIAEDGRVLFHSDPEHNVSENFFAETDQSRRLRALVAAKHSELLNLNYWGDGHRAFVTSMGSEGFPWSLVTFYDRQILDTVNVEWFISAVAFTLIYCSAFALVGVGTLLLRPTYRAPWLWPDPTQSPAYLRLFSSYLLFGTAWAAAFCFGDLRARLWIAGVLPVLAWVVAFVALRGTTRRAYKGVTIGSILLVAGLWLTLAWGVFDREVIVWDFVFIGAIGLAIAPHLLRLSGAAGVDSAKLAPPLNLSYGLAAGALTVITAVLPPITFFTVSHKVHVGTLVRSAQLGFSRDLAERERIGPADRGSKPATTGRRLVPCRRSNQDTPSHDPWLPSCDAGIYSEFFFCTRRVGDSPACDNTVAAGGKRRSRTDDITVPQILEEMLPYYSEAAVKTRELMHEGSDESGWRWDQLGSELRFVSRAMPQAVFASEMPRLTGNGPMSAERNLALLIGVIVIGAVVFLIVRFGLRRVFVVDLTMPLWSGPSGEVPSMSGPSLFLLSKNDAANFLQPSSYLHIDLREVRADGELQTRWFEEQFNEVAQLPPERNVLISHFDDRMNDQAFNDRKLAFVERLLHVLHRTVMIVSAIPPNVFFGTGSSPAGPGSSSVSADSGPRWSKLLAEFSLIPVGSSTEKTPPDSEPRWRFDWRTGGGAGELLWRVSAFQFYRGAQFVDEERQDPFVRGVWDQILPYAWQANRRAPLDLSQLLVEVGERLENYYQGLWASCTDSERIVLGNVAVDYLVNEKDKRAVRGLMARGLIRRQPFFRVMNETFRRFVLSTNSTREMAVLQGQVSSWDSVRWPFLIVLAALTAVFFTTQHELFNQTLGIISAVAAGLPAFVKLISVVSGTKRDS
jgi:hypothetical protein